MVRQAGKTGLRLIVCGMLLCAVGCGSIVKSSSPAGSVELFNGRDFSGWERFIPDPAVDVDSVWQIDGDVIRCAGVPKGYIRTKTKFKDYHLHVEWRWPEKPTNSGVLLYAVGPDEVWPACIEAQLQAGNAGDFVLMKGRGLTVDGVRHQDASKQFVVIKKKHESSENPPGQWNSYDIYCKGDSIKVSVNGVLQNEGTGADVTSGWICLQSEGGPVEFKNIYILPLD